MPPLKTQNPGIPADMRARMVRVGGNVKTFTPQGPIMYAMDVAGNPPKATTQSALSRDKRATQGARFLLGFNVKGVPKWTLEDVIPIVFEIRREQVKAAINEEYATDPGHGGDIAASFVAQKGLWQPRNDPSANPEDGAQIIILNNIDEREDYFRLDMEYIAEELATRLDQDAVVVEHQIRGQVEESALFGRRQG